MIYNRQNGIAKSPSLGHSATRTVRKWKLQALPSVAHTSEHNTKTLTQQSTTWRTTTSNANNSWGTGKKIRDVHRYRTYFGEHTRARWWRPRLTKWKHTPEKLHAENSLMLYMHEGRTYMRRLGNFGYVRFGACCTSLGINTTLLALITRARYWQLQEWAWKCYTQPPVHNN